MKNVIRSAASLLAFGLMIVSVSCNKKADIAKVAGDGDANYWPDQRYCNIDSIKITGTNDYYKFNYDAQGDPVSIIGNSFATGDPNKFFFYDGSKKLIRYVGVYANAYGNGVTFENFTKYVYGANNRVIRDTTYNFGDIVAGQPTNYYSWTVSYYSYDTLNRISQVVFTWEGVPGSGWTTNYNYDSNGNLIKSGVTYDNRNNIHNTNNWWRLISRDYSKNNPYTAASYTGYWLPRNIFSDGITNNRYFLNIELPQATIRYICD
jgi:hypothetical protein